MGALERISQTQKVAVVGLGYVGLPLALAFAREMPVIGYDKNSRKIQAYKRGEDATKEAGEELLHTDMVFTDDPSMLSEADFVIVAVPTPVHMDKTPDLTPVKEAAAQVGSYLKRGATVVFESTVYPGVTEEICVPAIEAASGLLCGKDFYVGYSPERINPGDQVHRLADIVKIVSGMDEETTKVVAAMYQKIIRAGVYCAGSIRVAEAAKLVENSQRDINIAFMNELSMAFERMHVPTDEVIRAMNTKWNALHFYPGLVGGHCIGVDPYYFVYQAEQLGYHSQIIAAGRKVNDDMPVYVAQMILKQMILADIPVRGAHVCMMGVTFKENCPDLRNSKAKEILAELREYGMELKICDPVADADAVLAEFGIRPVEKEAVNDADCLVFAAAHDAFARCLPEQLSVMYRENGRKKLLIDLRGIYRRKQMEQEGFLYWSL